MSLHLVEISHAQGQLHLEEDATLNNFPLHLSAKARKVNLTLSTDTLSNGVQCLSEPDTDL
jgi:hypothetical protein